MENIDKKAITDLAKLLNENKLSEIEYESGQTRIRVVSGITMAQAPVQTVMAQSAPIAVETAKPMETKKEENLENAVKSPMVGIVYLSADPSAPPYVSIGDMVGVGQTLCLIEAMKTFNPVKATKAGKVKRIMVESGSPVEFNEPMFVIE